jgi:hypothetical protein
MVGGCQLVFVGGKGKKKLDGLEKRRLLWEGEESREVE